ncbi:heme ABC transporter permease [Aquabacterium sp. NJ1]|uniref:heme exporter protein CcmB n=1 Tax=Aquabacterium sp. NJ1 TaxID=1538295 RepID=UPI00052CC756|nr:heme exporter protein CcmB [Aquabacterium sp. NJ1]KGM40757.1 heme ABC transporter permease [Aquabacterium sp. NJ1]
MWPLILRDWRLAARRRVEALLPLVFFIVAASLFPLGVGPEPQTLRTIAPGVVWVCALLASLLSLGSLYGSDFADGSLEQMLLSGRSLPGLALAKAFSHWTINGLPLVLASPVLGLLFDLPGEQLLTLVISLLLGTPVLSLLGGVGAALTLGLRSGGMLIVLLVLPLAVPVLIFGAGAVVAVSSGLSPEGHLSLLGALLLLTVLGAPWATAAALKIALD